MNFEKAILCRPTKRAKKKDTGRTLHLLQAISQYSRCHAAGPDEQSRDRTAGTGVVRVNRWDGAFGTRGRAVVRFWARAALVPLSISLLSLVSLDVLLLAAARVPTPRDGSDRKRRNRATATHVLDVSTLLPVSIGASKTAPKTLKIRSAWILGLGSKMIVTGKSKILPTSIGS
jgi:hypothetical protein